MFNPYGFGFYLKSGVMENGVICKTEEGSPQGGPLSPLLANIYLNEFDWENLLCLQNLKNAPM